jgi:hypothetical protein
MHIQFDKPSVRATLTVMFFVAVAAMTEESIKFVWHKFSTAVSSGEKTTVATPTQPNDFQPYRNSFQPYNDGGWTSGTLDGSKPAPGEYPDGALGVPEGGLGTPEGGLGKPEGSLGVRPEDKRSGSSRKRSSRQSPTTQVAYTVDFGSSYYHAKLGNDGWGYADTGRDDGWGKVQLPKK